MLELTFAEIAVSFCGYLYKEHIKSNGVLNLEISSPPFKKHVIRYLSLKTVFKNGPAV